MEPRIEKSDELLIAGLTGKADQTGDLWGRFSHLDRRVPLKNRQSEDGYEIRFYSGTVEPEVHVGVWVKNTSVPNDYEIRIVPPSAYAVFEIYPVKGYASRNEEMDRWLRDNGKYSQAGLGDRLFSVLVYGSRFKGEKDPTSVVDCWVPVKSAD